MSAGSSTLREDLVIESLRRSGSLRLQMRGESMLPALWPGDLAEIEACSPSEVVPGEIVLAVRERRFFLHRLVTQAPGLFLTRGDSMPGTDPMFPSSALLGRLVSVARAGKTVPVAGLSHKARILGSLLCYSGMARRIALKFHRRRLAAGDHTIPFGAVTADLWHREGL